MKRLNITRNLTFIIIGLLILTILAGLDKCQERTREAKNFNDLALLYNDQIRIKELKKLYNLGDSYSEQGKYLEAEKIFKQALEVNVKLFGEKHPKIAYTLNNLGALYIDQGRYLEAESLLLESLKLHQKIFGEDHSYTITVKQDYEFLKHQIKYSFSQTHEVQ